MSYDGRVYRILIASPSDVEEERKIAVSVIQQWNDLHSYSRKVVLLPLRWETHVAPAYPVRPQEVINQVIVDQCDILVGIFWTRIGTPTGEADSGTLEEIERVAKAGKPVMLYFSTIGANPGALDLDQLNRLREFQQKTLPNSLSETYASHLEFRDMFYRHLEMKIGDLQKQELSGPPPLTLSFVSLETKESVGAEYTKLVKIPTPARLKDLTTYSDQVSPELLREAFDAIVETAASVPIILSIKNISSSGIRNPYVEVTIRPEAGSIEVSESLETEQRALDSYSVFRLLALRQGAPMTPKADAVFAELQNKGLVRQGDVWKLCSEWGALQPQRVLFLRPFYVAAKSSSNVKLSARIYSDSFPEPLQWEGMLHITVEESDFDLRTLVRKIAPSGRKGSKPGQA